jgi:hypothetical protein
MKSTSLQRIALGLTILSVCSCQVQDDSVGMNFQSETPQEEKALTCEDLLQLHEEFEGQEIELSAISWGTSPSEDGEEILMSIDDEVLQGLQQAHVLVHFSKDQKEEIKDFAENDSISLTAKVGSFEFGAVRLVNPKITPN